MADFVNGLTWNVPITNKDGTPTNEFMRKWLQQAAVNGTIPDLSTAALVSAVIDLLGSTEGDLLVRGATEWAGLPSGTLGDLLYSNGPGNVPSYASLATLLDILGATEGDLLVRGPSGWQVLAAGTATDVLTSSGPGALPTWAPGGGGGGGYPPGTPPTIVQVAFSVNGTNGATFLTAPTNGNLLVAMNFNPASPSTGSGWVQQTQNSSGTDWGTILTKTAGAGESTTQSPMSGVSTTGGTVIWELAGQGANPFVGGLSQGEQTGLATVGILFPNVKNCIGLSAVGVVSGVTIASALNVGMQDVLDNSGTRCLAAGHTDLSQAPMAGLFALLSGSGSSKAATCLITS